MARPDDSRSFARSHRLTQFAMLSRVDEAEYLRNRRIFTRQMPRLVETVGKHARSTKQLLIEGPDHREAFRGEIAALHADDVEARQRGVLPAGNAKRDHVAAHPGEGAN